MVTVLDPDRFSLEQPLPPNGATLLLVRHGQTMFNAEGRAQGWIDVPLSPLGYRQAEATAATLQERRFAAIYSSPLARAYATALAIGRPHRLAPRIVADLREVHVGALSGRTWVEAEALYPKAIAAYRAAEDAGPHPRHKELLPGWEPIAAFLSRIWRAIGTIAEAHAGDTVAIVGHGGVINGFLTHALTGDATAAPWAYRHGNGAVSEVKLSATGPQMITCNQVLHDVHGAGDVIF